MPLLHRRRLELGRALATRPELILLDEIAGGLAEHESREVIQIVRNVQKQGISVVMIEHIITMMTEGVTGCWSSQKGTGWHAAAPIT